MGPVLSGLGMAVFTAHMFVFYFAVASAITPPVALAAFAAASITKQDPMQTGLAAVRIGIVMFVIPFVFAFNPELLLIEAAFLDPGATDGSYLPGYDGTVDWGALALILARLLLALVLLASALARFDRTSLATWDWGLRLALALFVMSGSPLVHVPAVLAGVAILAWHRFGTRGRSAGTA
ncbi:MAG: TRAP transporter large permease subunit, partial [Boseongicola sp. SB0662_bin_57]|nr:TRAP transporter large permease subunit [Boseongicola sp. SB0662_bin_57]